jgi:hypothetical protein
VTCTGLTGYYSTVPWKINIINIFSVPRVTTGRASRELPLTSFSFEDQSSYEDRSQPPYS